MGAPAILPNPTLSHYIALLREIRRGKIIKASGKGTPYFVQSLVIRLLVMSCDGNPISAHFITGDCMIFQ